MAVECSWKDERIATSNRNVDLFTDQDWDCKTAKTQIGEIKTYNDTAADLERALQS
jgi:hypothetical protein